MHIKQKSGFYSQRALELDVGTEILNCWIFTIRLDWLVIQYESKTMWVVGWEREAEKHRSTFFTVQRIVRKNDCKLIFF